MYGEAYTTYQDSSMGQTFLLIVGGGRLWFSSQSANGTLWLLGLVSEWEGVEVKHVQDKSLREKSLQCEGLEQRYSAFLSFSMIWLKEEWV